ncbi:MAG: peptidase S53, partial [Caulobacter sp.]|nr:peptidase S53 [Vitreoscilla sp.]
ATASADAAASSAFGDVAAIDSGTATQVAATEVTPAYHMAPVLLDEPTASDAGGTNTSARYAPKSWQADGDLADLPTARLSRDVLTKRISELGRMRTASAPSETVTPNATTITGTVFTPAQIRAAYGLVALPAVGASLTTAQAAALGAGQTIYLIDAYHDATALSDLNAFSTKFGLPTCTNVVVATTATTLAAAPSTCTFSQLHSTLTNTMTAAVPAYNGTWAPESKLDVQWAHAIAPLARIVLVEMPDPMSSSILGATQLVKKLGAGVVSMSFGSVEAGWAASYDGYFVGTGMTYVASAGDAGTEVLWPAVSPSVLAVGGTGMNWSGSARTEVAWSSTGGGMSAKVPLPAYQSGFMSPGGVALARRAVPDVAFNASPTTGQYVALTLPGAATVWSAYAGTSIAAPQWAGIVAVANAIRAVNSKAALGDIHTMLYKSIAAVPGAYASSMGDVTEGSNGTCATCKAGVGYDMTTGLGTPNATGLLASLTGVSTTTAVATGAPTVPGGNYTGKSTAALSQSLNVTAPSGTTTSYTLSGAPSGLTVDTTGTLKWAAPVAGSYSFTAKATTAAGKSAQATYALKVIPGTNPAFTSNGVYTATGGSAFSGALSATNPNTGTLTYSVTGAPSGLAVSTTGAISWASAVAGTYAFTAKVTDNYGYASTQAAKFTVATATTPTASTNHAPTLAAASFAVKAGATWSTMVSGKDADGDALSYSLSGAPTGVKLTSSGMLYWVGAVKGTYKFNVIVKDAKGATGAGAIALVVS